MTWVAVAAVVAVLIEVGAVTDGFGIPSLVRPHATASPPPPPGPNPNPYGELVTGVLASIAYGNANRSFPALQGTQLCNGCPVAPKENTSYDPPVAGFWFFFNVTDEGSDITSLANFTLSTSGPTPGLFQLVGVVCCYPSYVETVFHVDYSPGFTFGFGVFAIATSIPYDGSTGYSLYFNATSP